MVSRIMAVAVFVGAVAVAATDDVDTAGLWPASVSYQGRTRDAAWLDATFVYFRSKLVEVDGAWVMTAPRDRWAEDMRPGEAAMVRIQPTKVLADDDFLVRLAGKTSAAERSTLARIGGVVDPGARPTQFSASGSIVRLTGATPPKSGTSTKHWQLRVAALRIVTVGNDRVVACVPMPDKSEPLSRQQFLNCLESGFRLYEWRWKYKPLRPRGKIATWYRRYVK